MVHGVQGDRTAQDDSLVHREVFRDADSRAFDVARQGSTQHTGDRRSGTSGVALRDRNPYMRRESADARSLFEHAKPAALSHNGLRSMTRPVRDETGRWRCRDQGQIVAASALEPL